MNLTHLAIFIKVAEEGSFTRAAAGLYISAATTSRAVSSLEEALGVRLLYMKGRKLLAEADKLTAELKKL